MSIAATLGMAVAREVIPGLIGKLGKGRGGAAESVAESVADIVSAVTGLTPDNAPDEAVRLLRDNPEAYRKVQAEAYRLAIAEIEAETARLKAAMADRASARDMHVRREDRTVFMLVIVASIFAFVALGSVIAMAAFQIDISGTMGTLLGAAVAAAFTRLEQVFGFFFGSSSGSKAKTEIFERSAPRD